MKLFAYFIVSLLFGCGFIAGYPNNRNRNSESDSDSDSWTGFSGRLSGRSGLGSDSDTKTFGSGRFGSFSSSSRLSGGSSDADSGSDDDGFNLETFVGFGKVSEKGESAAKRTSENQGTAAVAEPLVIETGSQAHVDNDELSAGGQSGIAGAQDESDVDLESIAGVKEKHAFGRSSSRARQTDKAESRTDHSHVGAVSAAASADNDQLVNSANSEEIEGFFVRSSLSRHGEDSKVSGQTEGFGGSRGSFGITFEDDE